MKNLFNFFVSFEKLFKEKLVAPFFWLAILVFSLEYFADFLAGLKLAPLAWIVEKFIFVGSFVLGLVVIRILAEIAIAVFRINDNVSPDGGKSESADIDIIAETKKAAEAASKRAKELTHSATEKTKSSFDNAKDSVKDNMDDISDSVKDKAKSAGEASKKATKSLKTKTSEAKKKASDKVSETVKAATPKPSAKKAPTKTTSAETAKRGPKPGTKAPRDKDGNLLKKDGTPRKKPGPQTKN